MVTNGNIATAQGALAGTGLATPATGAASAASAAGVGLPSSGAGGLAALSSGVSSAPTKALFENREARSNKEKEIPLQFNPTQLSVSRSITWTKVPVQKRDEPTIQARGGDSPKLSMDLLFDTTEDGGDVRKYTSKILTLTKVEDRGGGHFRPPICVFRWGSLRFQGIIESLGYNFIMFRDTGTPIRATMNLSMTQYKGEPLGQNSPPTGIADVKVHTVKAGETIDQIAAQEYGDPGAWRFIATTNNLDNPKDLTPGQALLIEPRAY